MKKAKKATAKKQAAKPAAKKKTAKPAAKVSRPAVKSASTYTPQPIQGVGWAPFRYPLK